jgi:hypothetical protein
MHQLLEIVRRDWRFGDDVAPQDDRRVRDGGRSSDLVTEYRSRHSGLL